VTALLLTSRAWKPFVSFEKLSGQKNPFLAPKKLKQPLISLAFSEAFQADDEGSIPFTRSNDFNGLCHVRHLILTRGLMLILTIVRLLFV
jgi:hypothetical protein